jgi:phosphate transport system substrate-binding protein
MRTTKKLLLATTIYAALGTALAAQTVTLQSEDGKISMSGQLLGFSNGSYQLRTELGDMNIRSSIVSCIGDGCPVTTADTGGDFQIAGSDTIGEELMPLLIKGFAESQGAVVERETIADRTHAFNAIGDGGLGDNLFNVVVEDFGSSTGFEALIAGEAGIGMSSRQIKREEVRAFRDGGLGDPLSFAQEHAIAVDGMVIVVHPDNPVSALSDQQISGLLSGAITNWSELGGPDLPVSVYTRNSDSGTFSTISDRFLAPFNAQIASGSAIVDGNQTMTDSVFSDPGAIGYVGFAYKGDAKPVSLVSSCGVVAEASAFGAKTGEYPLQRTLYLYTTNRELPAAAQNLVSFASSPEATGLIEKSGFLAFNVSGRDQSSTAAAVRAAIEEVSSPSEIATMRELYIDMQEYTRLSPTFRFRTGSTALDNASQRDLQNLARYISQNTADTAEIAFVGFTDSDGSFEANRALGFSRAEAIRNQLALLLGGNRDIVSDVELKSFGELNPLGCNDDFRGQQLNRRVEVWIRN